ncbi:MAG: chromosomal replication initiator protein DnaA [Patescibacteria group bacterium]
MNNNELESLWLGVITELKLSLSKTIFTTLFSASFLKDLNNQVAVIAFPSPYLADLVEKRYYSLIKASLDRQTGKNISLTFMVSRKALVDSGQTGPLFENKNSKEKKETEKLVKEAPQSQRPSHSRSGLHPNFTFENFVVGDTNHFAFAAAQGIIKNPGTDYNPLFIWGGVGVGKTHLMQAIGNQLLESNPGWKALYVSAETFGAELISAIKERGMSKFKNKYRQLDLLLIDDVQFIAGKEYTQDEFFHTFNTLHLAGKQIILTSDRKPEEIQPIEDRLTSRFMGGLTVDIQAPEFEMRVAILKQKASQRGVDLSEDATTFIAETIQSNARELEGALIQVSAQARVKNEKIDLDFVKNFFGVRKTAPNRNVSTRRIISVIANHYKIKTSQLTGQSRKKEIAIARHIAAYLLRKELQMPLQEIGRRLGNRDHTTIMHAEEKIDRLFSTNQQIRHDIIEMRKKIYT